MTDPDLAALARSTANGAGYGVTAAGFVPKPVGRILDEKIALARELFGADVDLTSGSVLRSMLELQSVEDSRTWVELAHVFASSHIVTAERAALSRLGAELGIRRPFQRASGVLTLRLTAPLPGGMSSLPLPRGTRLRSRGGTGVFLAEAVELDEGRTSATAPITAFEPGPAGDLDPLLDVGGEKPGLIDAFDPDDARAEAAIELLETGVLALQHDEALTGGTDLWADEPYRDLLLAYPRNLWTPDALRVAVSLVPGVRQVVVKDLYGGLDVHQAIFGNFSFLERLFTEQRSIANPYFVTVLVAPEEAAIWDGPQQLAARVREAVDRVRPIGIAPAIEQASLVGVGFRARIIVDGLPLGPSGIAAGARTALLGRIEDRVRRYVGRLRIGEAVLASEITWAIMNEPGVVDVKELRLVRYPPALDQALLTGETEWGPQQLAPLADAEVSPTEVAVLVLDHDRIEVV